MSFPMFSCLDYMPTKTNSIPWPYSSHYSKLKWPTWGPPLRHTTRGLPAVHASHFILACSSAFKQLWEASPLTPHSVTCHCLSMRQQSFPTDLYQLLPERRILPLRAISVHHGHWRSVAPLPILAAPYLLSPTDISSPKHIPFLMMASVTNISSDIIGHLWTKEGDLTHKIRDVSEVSFLACFFMDIPMHMFFMK